MEALILTKSAMEKNGNRGSCVTAHDLKNNRFVRFVAKADGSPVPYFISKQFNVLDYVSVQVMEACPIAPQTENLLVNVNTFQMIRPYGFEAIEEVYNMLPPPSAPRFMEKPGYSLPSVKGYDHSLELIRVSGLRILRKSYRDAKKAAGKAQFWHNSYFWDNFSVTDQTFDIRKTDREVWEIGDAYVMVSIPTQPFQNGEFYKFIAAIYPRQPDILEGRV